VRWDIITPAGTRSYQMTVDAGSCQVTPGVPPSPRVMLGVDLPDFLRLVAGRLDGMQAFMAGRLRLSGDMGVAHNLEQWFG
jgi:putative sterol carrier protein